MLWLGRCVSGQERRDRLCLCRLSMSMSVTVYLIRTHKSWPQSAVARSCSSDGAGRSCIWLSATVFWRCNPGQVTHTVTMVAFFGTSQLWVILCSWEGNHRSCVAFAMHPTIMMSPRGCKVSSFEPDCPFWGDLSGWKFQLELDIDIPMYTNPDPQFLAPARSLAIGQECPGFFDAPTWQPYVPLCRLRNGADRPVPQRIVSLFYLTVTS